VSVAGALRSGGALAAALLLLTSCNLLALNRDLRAGAAAGDVAGKVLHGEKYASVIVVFALREEPDGWFADKYVHLATQQDFLMRLERRARLHREPHVRAP